MHRVLVAVVGAFALSVATTAVAQHPHFGYAGEAAPAQMKEAFTVSKAQIDAFRQAVGSPNNRPVQPVNARVVLQ